MTNRTRLSATVDADLLRAGQRAVREGRTKSLSGWVNDALARQAEHDRRMKAMSDAIRAYEAEHGVITADDIRDAERYFRPRTIRVTPRARPKRTGSHSAAS